MGRSGEGDRDGAGDGDGDGVASSSSSACLFEATLDCSGGGDGDGVREGGGEGEGEGVASSSTARFARLEDEVAAFGGGGGKADAALPALPCWTFFLGPDLAFALVASRGGDGGDDTELLAFAARVVAAAFGLGGGEGDAEAVASLSCSTSPPPPRRLPFLAGAFASASASEAEAVSEPGASWPGREALAVAAVCLFPRPEDAA